MKTNDLNKNEKMFLDLFHAVERKGGPEFLALVAFMLASVEEGQSFPELRSVLENATVEQLELAVDVLRESPSNLQEDVNCAAEYIRKEFLHKD